MSAWHEGDLVHKLRCLSKWTVKILAARAGTPTSVIYRLEHGFTKQADRATVTKLAKAFGLSYVDFISAVPAGSVRVPLAGQSATREEQKPRRRQHVGGG